VDTQRAAGGHFQGRRFPANVCRRNNSSGGYRAQSSTDTAADR